MTQPTPTLFKRDANGLIVGVNYPTDAMGRIDWRRLIQPCHLYVSPDSEATVMTRQNVKSKWDVDVTKCEDKELLITLAGLKYLARLRGIKAVRVANLHVDETSVTSSCSIEFIPNFENPDGLIMEAQASASLHSVSGKFQLYLAAFAQNRAYTRAVKDALGIEILGFEEVDFKASKAYEKALSEGKNPLAATTKSEESTIPVVKESHDPHGRLAQVCAAAGISFDVLKARAIEYRAELTYDQTVAAGEKIDPAFDPINWTGINKESIPRRDVFTLLGKIQEAQDKKAADKKASKKTKKSAE